MAAIAVAAWSPRTADDTAAVRLVAAVDPLDLAQRGRAELAAGRPEKAMPLLEQAVPLIRREYGHGHAYLAYALDDLAKALLAQGRLDDARRRVEEAVVVVDAAPQASQRDRALIRGNRGAVLARLGLFRRAADDLRRAHELFARELGAEHPTTVLFGRNLASIYVELDEHERARSLLETAADALARAGFGNAAERIGVLTDLSGVLLREEDVDGADRRLAEARKLIAATPGGDAERAALVDIAAAKLAIARSRLAEGEELLKKAEKTLGPSAGPAKTQLLYTRGFIQTLRRRAVEAEATYREVLRLYERLLGPNHPATARALHALGLVYLLLGEYPESQRFFERSIATGVVALGETHPAVAETRTEYSRLLVEMGLTRESITEADRAIAAFDAAGNPRPLRRAFASNARGFALKAAGHIDEAEAAFTSGVEQIAAIRGDHSSDLWPGLLALAEIALGRGDLAKAEKRLAQALAILETDEANTVEGLGNALLLAGRLAQTRGDVAQALAAFRRATKIAVDRLDVAERSGSAAAGGERMKSRLLFEAHLAAASEQAEAASLWAEMFEVAQYPHLTSTAAAVSQMNLRFATGKGELAKLLRRRQDTLEQWRAVDGLLTQALAGAASGARLNELRLDLDRQAIAIRTMDTQIAQRFPRYSELTRPTAVSAAAVQQLLAPDEALLLQLTDARGTHAFLLTSERLRYARTDLGAEALHAAVAALRDQVDLLRYRRYEFLPPFDTGEAYRLYRGIFAPFEADLEHVEHVVFVPDGEMQSIAPHLLLRKPAPRPRSGTSDYRDLDYLVRRFSISLVPSAGAFAGLRAIGGSSRSERPFIGFGNPDFRGQPDMKKRGVLLEDVLQPGNLRVDLQAMRKLLPTLPETERELEDIGKMLGASPGDLYFGKMAGEDLVKRAALDKYRVVAFATHGLLASETQIMARGYAEPALALTPPAKASAIDDGLLTASEVAQLSLDADLVVLSACNTAGPSGEPRAEGLSGLARAFFYAGSRSLLVSHWYVDSEAAGRITTGLFAHLKKSPGQSRAGALRAVMLDLIEALRPEHAAHPAFWAPFVLVGEG